MKRSSISTILISIVIALTFLGCTREEPPKPVEKPDAINRVKDVGIDSLESNRGTAKANGVWNAKNFRADHPEYKTYTVAGDTDSTMRGDCPQGDGWVTVTMTNADNVEDKIKLKCSSMSASVGCMLESDFKGKSYASDDGSCQSQSKVPLVLPKLQE